jgi:hypothetical protein
VNRQLGVNLGACALLLVQYLLGMAVNVYVVLPGRHPGAGAGDYFSGAAAGLAWLIADGPAWAAVHAAVGMTLAAAALAAAALAWREGSTAGTVASAAGALAIIGAGFNGASFVDYGHAFSSMIMGGLWAVALACYLTGAVLAAWRREGGPGRPASRDGRVRPSGRRASRSRRDAGTGRAR